MKSELRRLASNLRTALKRWGYRVSTVHHSPLSLSIYYEVWHPSDPQVAVTDIRLSDHHLPYPNTRQLELVATDDATRNDAELASIIDEFDPQWQDWNA